MIKILVAQGWSKNEIIYEMQRVFGNDVLILTNRLDDERSLAARFLPVFALTLTAGFFFLTQKRINTGGVIKASKKATKSSSLSSAERDELKKKLMNRQ